MSGGQAQGGVMVLCGCGREECGYCAAGEPERAAASVFPCACGHDLAGHQWEAGERPGEIRVLGCKDEGCGCVKWVAA